jgi:hypothetical protein
VELARKALAGLLWLYVIGVLVQFFLAGLGLPQLGDEGMGTHEDFGWSALHLTPILLLIIAFVAKVSKRMLALMLVFVVITFVQPLWASEFQGEAIAALHILGAAVILAMSHALAMMATRHMRGEPTE